MSHYAEEEYTLYQEDRIRARKEHVCSACKETIPATHHYWRVVVIYDKEASTIKRCLRCQKIHLHLRDLGSGEMWPDEKLNCGELYEDHWGEEPPPEIAALAFTTAEELQKSVQGKTKLLEDLNRERTRDLKLLTQLRLGWAARHERLLEKLRSDRRLAESVACRYHHIFSLRAYLSSPYIKGDETYKNLKGDQAFRAERDDLVAFAKKELVRLERRIAWVEKMKNPFGKVG